MEYLIHTCPQRRWYVDRYLIPSMVNQGIKDDNIAVYSDHDGDGHLISFVKGSDLMLHIVGDSCDGVWHLQDDVIISRNFRVDTEKNDSGIVCGFCNCYSDKNNIGVVNADKMWYSMPCIRIPNDIMAEFITWIWSDETREKYRYCFISKKHSDVLFLEFLKEKHPDIIVLNLAPNLVNHVDHLIGGSIINVSRAQTTREIMSVYWEDDDLIKQLEESLNGRSKGFN